MTGTSISQTGYTIRVSHRAKQVILKVSGRNGLEVVVPSGFNTKLVPKILKANLAWITNQLEKAERSPTLTRPEHIDLSAIDQRWEVEYQPGPDGRFSLLEASSDVLQVQGDADDAHGIAIALNHWLHAKANTHLVPWLKEVSQEIDISFKKTTVRGQATRWASCSKAGNISLNRSLLFLPERLVRHVFLHELCHIKQLNHSPAFWDLLQELEPDSKALEAEVRKADQYLPQWVQWRKRG